MKVLASAVLMALMVMTAYAEPFRADSVAIGVPWCATPAAGVVMTAAGALSRPAQVDTPPASDAKEGFGMVDVVEYAPLALPWAVKACGGATRSGWGRMALSQGAGLALMCGTVYLTKYKVEEMRPDGGDSHSFPSGHSAWAFMGATMATNELAWRSPWYGFGAYALASGVGLQRVMSRRHYPCDVAAGAGLGMVTAQLGYVIGDMVFGSRGYDSRYIYTPGVAICCSYLQVSTAIGFNTATHIDVGPMSLHVPSTLATVLEGGVRVAPHLTVGARASLSSTPVTASLSGDFVGQSTLNEASLAAVAACHFPVWDDCLLLSARLGVGAMARFNMHHIAEPVTVSRCSPMGVAGVECALPLTSRLSIAVSIDYTLSQYKYVYTPTSDTSSALSHNIAIGVASRVNF